MSAHYANKDLPLISREVEKYKKGNLCSSSYYKQVNLLTNIESFKRMLYNCKQYIHLWNPGNIGIIKNI